jgi:glutamate-5-semialdehyde dehydrogenase
MMSIEEQILAIGKKARAAAVYMAKANTQAKNKALLETAKLIRAKKAALSKANEDDMAQAKAA